MNIEDQIWELVAKKLTKEASKEELRRLDTLLWENPKFYHVLKLMFEWWDDGGVLSELEDEENYWLFAKVMTSIKDTEAVTAAKPDITKLQYKIQQAEALNYKQPGKSNLVAFFNKQITMMYSYLKIAWRCLLRNKAHTSL
ncbi:hypothetical protein [Mucilaginibacter sp. OK098]|uniref:hypothetical protein n=1 Tax=Mucilaginibacter sp. OK098 TaxID=1855297 RepID=UPI0009116142|nr:hypothetical protein [Mucilaginibacter sp. OK098]SHM44799.1 hypothetical protein SAMN05216524_102139 [Mucilaginibacter sp. OK098]